MGLIRHRRRERAGGSQRYGDHEAARVQASARRGSLAGSGDRRPDRLRFAAGAWVDLRLRGRDLRCGHAGRRRRPAKPNRPTSQQRTTRPAAPSRPGTRGLWSGSGRGGTPEPRETAGISLLNSRCGPANPGDADYVAVDAVYLELVSESESLIRRENTGKLSRSRLSARPASPIRPVLGVLAGVFPAFGNRETSASEHGFPPAPRAESDERAPLQCSEIAGVLGRPTFGTLRRRVLPRSLAHSYRHHERVFPADRLPRPRPVQATRMSSQAQLTSPIRYDRGPEKRI